ncbi:S1-C subfamily serine protease [Saccharothrix tamanrassetensis]|uniref:S1-C subfamily serine protease n=1 Tax=Saccharothrix tamanrassetensis TaxID=1051531 RepID=A0A841CM08_9PSEU|nr:serine protease [Saccharothrix tamanrassetensis]MBB5957973.1 S1-C subfamily serine protease [Saccharothrix tamanrassetensis]
MARVKALLGAVALLALAPLPAAAQPSSPEERAAAVARPGIVFIAVTWHGWVRDKRTGEVFGGTGGYEVKTSCSGAVISPDGYVATASHCVHTGPLGGGGALFEAAIADLAKTGRVRDPAKARTEFAEHGQAEGAAPDSTVDRRIQVERMVTRDSEQVRDVAPATVVDLVAPADGDVAVLKIPREHLPSIELRQDQTPVGTPILAIGYPGSTDRTVDPSLEPSNKNGQISARRTQSGRPFYEFSAAATHGMSGGPVVDMQGGVVALISQGSPGETQSFNFAASSQTLVEVLKGKEITVGVGQHDRDYRTGLDRYFEGDYDGAVEYLDAALAGSPGHQQAAEYRRSAADKGGKPGSSPTTLLVVFAVLCGGIAVATATAGTAIALTRRKRLAAAADADAGTGGGSGSAGEAALAGVGSPGVSSPRVGTPAVGAQGWSGGPGLGSGPGTPAGGYPPFGTPPGGTPQATAMRTPSGGTPQASPMGTPSGGMPPPAPTGTPPAGPPPAPPMGTPPGGMHPAAPGTPPGGLYPFTTAPATPAGGVPSVDAQPTTPARMPPPVASPVTETRHAPLDLPVLPVVPGGDPERDGQADPGVDQADQRDGADHGGEDQRG